MGATTQGVQLDPGDIGQWAAAPFEALYSLTLDEVEGPQLAALQRRFAELRPQVVALDKLAARQEVDRLDTLDAVAPIFFDHRVYKSYPANLVERRQFDRLTAWLDRLTAHDLSAIPMDGIASVDAWLDRLDEHGMIMLHSTGTTGKLSFMPRSQTEWPAWESATFQVWRASTGIDRRVEALPAFWPGYRTGHATSHKFGHLFGLVQAGGEENRHVLYEYAMSSDLLSMAARLHTAEERGELDQLDIDPKLLEERAKLIERGRNRDADFERWFAKLSEQFAGRRVWLDGLSSDLVRIALKAQEEGRSCTFAPGSVVFTGGGMKGMKNPPEDWEGLLKAFFGVDHLCGMYAMTELMGNAPVCRADNFHLPPYTIPFLLDPDGNVLPREGVQRGRFGFVDLLAESYWGGFLTGDEITIYWDEDCPCGWKGPRLDRNIRRFSEMEGGDDKISCAGTEEAYSEFMDYVSTI